ncbi:hypothetical protein HGRIS_012400 [Hohenbuehelia grisea]|uniref:DUF5648 domain-containing protein n=1 Tax=Hohenbuehelia grisea TaxID=104357 RepID=A0ABR3IS50_9AGAR
MQRLWGVQSTIPVASIFLKPVDGVEMLPIFHLWSNQHQHYYTPNEAEAENLAKTGTPYFGVVGFTLKDPVCGAVPLYRRRAGPSRFATTEKERHDAGIGSGHIDEGTMGHVFQIKERQ